MKSTRFTSLLVAGLLVAIVGCSSGPLADRSLGRTVVEQQVPTPNSAPDDSSVPDNSSVSGASPPNRAGVVPVNYEVQPTGFRHLLPAGRHTAGACGCGACSAASCGSPQTVAPFGAVPPVFARNAYGIDPQEFLCDGGDQLGDAAVRQDDSVAGLQLEDTVAHYTTESGDIEIAASNKVCVYAPRFKSVRKVTGVVAEGRVVGLSGFGRRQGPTNVNAKQGGIAIEDSVELAHADVTQGIDALRERNRGVPVDNVLQLEQASDVLALLVGLTVDELRHLRDEQKSQLQELSLAAIAWSRNESVEVEILDLKAPVLTRDQSLESFTVYEFPDAGRVRVVKLADRNSALPGEIIHFAIRVENVGDSSVDQVVIRDNLTTRLEYVEDSQTSTIDASFSTQVNDGESLELAWKLNEPLEVGESATVRFRCRVR